MGSEVEKKTVLVTGFGPFGEHKVNASAECVKLLAETGLRGDVELITYEMPVKYATVKKIIPDYWTKHKPDLVVHVGVSSVATEITLEQQAHNDGYSRQDVLGERAEELCCVSGAEDCLVAGIDMEKVCQEVNCADIKTKAVISNDPGRYLCDFSFFTSLHIDRDRSAFIHVPPLNKPYTKEELVSGLKVAILSMLKQVPQPS